MSSFEYRPILKRLDDDGASAKDTLLPQDCYALAWTKDNEIHKQESNKQAFEVKPIVVYKPHEKFKSRPIILLPCTPQLDTRKYDNKTLESPMLPVKSKPEPKVEVLSKEHLSKYEHNATALLDWVKAAQAILKQPNADANQLAKLSFDCSKGKCAESIQELRQSIAGTVVPKNMPQLVEPWQQTKDKTKEVVDSFSQIAKALKDGKQEDASRLLENAASKLDSALNDGFDRASALADRLPKATHVESASDLSPEDKRKADQIKIFSAYETLGYYIGTLDAAMQTLGCRPYGEMEAADWERLEKTYRTFQRELTGLKAEFNQETMKRLEANKVLTEEQKHLLAEYRESIDAVIPALSSIENTSPFAGKKYTPIYSGLIDQMDDLRNLSWKISGKSTFLQGELNLKNEIKTAPDWKKHLLEQKLVWWQYYPLADKASDVKSEVNMLAQQANGATKLNKVNEYQLSRKHRKELLSAIDLFQADISPEAFKSLEEYDKSPNLTGQQVEFLRQFRNRYVQVQPHIEAIRQGIQPTESIDLSAINSVSTTLLNDLSNDRRLIMDTIRNLDDQIHMRKLSELTSPAVKPLVHQYKSYNELTQISNAIDAIERDARDILFLTGGYYSKKELATRLPESASSMLGNIRSFKNLVGSDEKRQQLASMISSSDLTAQQSAQLKGFYDNILVLIPQIDELENTVQLGPDKHFWKVSRTVRDQMDKSHNQGFEIMLAGFHLHGQLLKAMENQK